MNLQNQINKIVEFYRKGQLKEAKNIATKLIKTNSNVAILHNLLGAINKNLEDLHSAKLNFRKATNINTNYADAFSNLGTVLIELNDFEEAKKNY